MKPDRPFAALAACALFVSALNAAKAQEQASGGGPPAHLIVTVEPKHGANVPVINKDEVMVHEGKDRDTVTDWVPAQGDRAALEFFILIDDSSNPGLGSQLEDIRRFIQAQAATTKVGVAYMQNGTARVVQELTPDHTAAMNSLRLPMGVGGANASPYFALSDLIKRWPQSMARHEVLVVSDGIDRYYGIGDLQDPYLQTAIDDAQRAGVVVSAIYSPGIGHFGHSYWRTYWGQIYLSQLAERTGGEAYYIGFTGAPVSFSPYLEDLGRRLEHQYWLGFIPKPEKKPGWHNVRLSTEVASVDWVSADRVYVNER